jgi:hypothetical protein
MAFPEGAPLDTLSAPGFEVFTLSFTDALLDRAARELELPDIDRLLGGDDVVRSNPKMLRELRRSLTGWRDALLSVAPGAPLPGS